MVSEYNKGTHTHKLTTYSHMQRRCVVEWLTKVMCSARNVEKKLGAVGYGVSSVSGRRVERAFQESP